MGETKKNKLKWIGGYEACIPQISFPKTQLKKQATYPKGV
jgi:hypothetical protein